MKTLQIGMGWFSEQSGGLNRYYYDCIRYLPEAGVGVRGLVTGSERVTSMSDRFRIQTFAATETSLLNRWRGIREAIEPLTPAEYDLVVAHFALYAMPILDRVRKPLVFHFHGPWALESDAESQSPWAVWAKKSLERTVYGRASHFIVLSKAFKELLHQQYGVPPAKIHIVPGGVDLEKFTVALSATEARNLLGWKTEGTIIFCVRRLAKRMGLENLIQAMALVREEYPDVLLYIAGTGALAETLQQQIAELNLSDRVCLLGYLSDDRLPIAYRAANFSVIPTISFEGFGLIAIESLAVGTPVLGTPIGGIPEILEPFCSDLLFQDTSVEQLARGIIEVLARQRKLPDREACQDYASNYAWSVIAPKIKSVYQEAISY
jgi:glycosyltransferase involved in cell wall biosynthesis